MLTQPLDADPRLCFLLGRWGDGSRFTVREAAAQLSLPVAKARLLLREIRDALASCPEAVQLTIGHAGGATRFVRGSAGW